MRPTTIVQSGMPTGENYLGWWGNFRGPKQKGITQYSISNYRQNSLQGVFKHSLFQGFQRTIAQVPYFLVPAVIAYGTISWAVKRNEYLNSKAGHLETAEQEGH